MKRHFVKLMDFLKQQHRKAYRWFSKVVGTSKDETTRNLFMLFKIALFASFIILGLDLIILIFRKSETAGTFGDFFGGVQKTRRDCMI